MKRFAVIGFTALVLFSAACGSSKSSEKRPLKWAKPVQVKGVPNFYRVTDSLYRSAQPSAEGMANLKAMGIKTIVNLRSFHSDRDEIVKLGLASEHIPMKAWHPEEEDAVRFLQIVTDPKGSPFLVHCHQGSDRTGIMCALYRVAVQNWTKKEALDEMTKGGYGFHKVWKDLPVWFEKLDIEAIRKKAGIKAEGDTVHGG